MPIDVFITDTWEIDQRFDVIIHWTFSEKKS